LSFSDQICTFPTAALGGQLYLAPHDLRDPLVAHVHDLSDGLHRQAVSVSRPDGLIAFGSQTLGLLLQLVFTLGVILGKGHQALAGFRCLALGTGDAEDRPRYFC